MIDIGKAPLEVIGIDVKTDKYHMFFSLVVDMLPITGGTTVKSETMRIVTGRAIHPEYAHPPTIRSFN